MSLPRLYPGYFLFSLSLARRGYSSSSLSRSGFIAAALLGWLTLANPLVVFGACLLGFYAAGSRATKVKSALKATYEEPEHGPPSPSSSTISSSSSPSTQKKSNGGGGGNRTATQVSCNALLGVLFALSWRLLYSGEFGKGWEEEGRWCVTAREEEGGRRWSRALVLGAVAFWGACCGDTFASELGILSPHPPYLPSTLRPTPRGTNGALSPFGTYVSLAGGLLVSVIAIVTMVAQGQVERCGRWVNEVGEWGWAGEVLAVGGAAGLGGSLIDSLLGFLFQPTYYSPSRKLVVHHRPSSSSKDDTILLPGTAILGDWLSNNAVNAVSTTLVAVGAVGYSLWW